MRQQNIDTMQVQQIQEMVVDLQFDGVDTNDAPKYTNAYICEAKLDDKGAIRNATDQEVQLLNSDYSWLNERVGEHIVGMVEDCYE